MPSEQDRKQQWQNILQLTQQLKQMFIDEEWESMTELESKRQQMLKGYFETPVSPAEAEDIASEIKQMLHINNEIIQGGQSKQSKLSSSAQQLSSNRQAIHAYHDVQK
jgi:Flagellar protein FliT